MKYCQVCDPIYDKIDEWHGSKSELTVYEYIGMT